MLTNSLLLVATTAAWAGQPMERFRSADHFTFCNGSTEARYGNADATVTITMQVNFLGQQVFSGAGNAAEARYNKTAGSLNFSLKLSDFDPNLPPEVINLSGTDLGSDRVRHVANQVIPGPIHLAGTTNGTSYDITMTNVQVNSTISSQLSNSVTLPYVNPVLGELADVQADDYASDIPNSLTAVPAQVSGWVLAPLFTVRSMRIDVTGLQQAGQVPAHVIAPDSVKVNVGRLDAGTVASLGGLDSDVFRGCRSFVPNFGADPVNVEVTGQVGPAPQYLSLWSVSRMATAGSFGQRLEMFDVANGYAGGDTRFDPVTGTFSVQKLDATGAVARYLDGNGTAKARYRVKQTGFTATFAWCHEQDQLVWVVTP